MLQLLFFVAVATVVSCYAAKKIGAHYKVDPKKSFWVGLSVPTVAYLVYEWCDHHKEDIKRTFAKKRG